MMRCIVSLVLLLLCACGEDSPTSNDSGSVDKASLIPGEYEGVAMLKTISQQMTGQKDTTNSTSAFTATFADSSFELTAFFGSGGLSSTYYYAHGDTLVLIPALDGTTLSGPYGRNGGAYKYTHDGDVMILDQIGDLIFSNIVPPPYYVSYLLYTDENYEHPHFIEMTRIYYMRKIADYEEDES